MKHKVIMAQKDVEVELIPWEHALHSSLHKDVIEYIKTLPKNSHIAIELSFTDFEILIKAMDHIAGEKAPIEIFPHLDPFLVGSIFGNPFNWASWEIFQECRKRNIAVIPIDVSVVFKKGEAMPKKRGMANFLKNM